MAEKTNPEIKEEVVETEVESTVLEEFEGEKKDITEGIEKAQQENSQKVTDALKEAERALNEARLKAFLKEKGLDEKTQYKDLTPEQLAEYNEYQLPEAEVERIYKNAKNSIIPITDERNKTLNTMEDRITDLYNKADAKYKELEQELANTPATPENEAKRAQLEQDMDSMKSIMGELGPEKGAEAPMRKTLASAMKTHTESNKGVRAKLGQLFGEERVNADPDIQKTLMTAKERKEQGIVLEGETPENPENQEIEDQEKEGKDEKVVGEEKAQKAGGQQIDPKLAEALKAAAVANAVKDVVEEKPNYLGLLGYNAGNVLNAKSSMAMLANYVGQDITDDQRLAMLNDPETRDVILEAMAKANSSLNPLNRIKFNKTRARLVQLAKGEMVRKAVESLGEKHPKDIEASFNKAKEDYSNLRKEIEDKMAGDITEEQKSELQTQLDELNDKYKSINNVEIFRDKAKDLERFRDRAAEKISSMLGRNDQLALPKETPEVKEQVEVTNSEVKQPEKREVSGFRSNLQKETTSNQERIESDIRAIKNEEQRQNALKIQEKSNQEHSR